MTPEDTPKQGIAALRTLWALILLYTSSLEAARR
jgi:hypothetical protein